MSTEGSKAIVTGGTSGIGKATARALAEQGADVVVASRNRENGEAAERELGEAGDVRFVATDVRDGEQVAELVETTVEETGGLDILVNAAGIEGPGKVPFDEWTEEDCEDVLATNVKGPFLATKAAMPHLLEDGRGTIVNVASFVGTKAPVPGAEVYGATKAAVVSMTRSLAVAYEDEGLTVHGVAPWITDTPMVDRLTGGNEDAKGQLAGMNPSGRIVEPDDVGRVIGDLVAGQIVSPSGETLLVDAGGKTEPLGR